MHRRPALPEVGVSMVEVLRRVGCEVVFDERQTCCGQPAFNTGYRHEARKFAKRFIEIFEDSDADAIVSPPGSCTAMVRHFHELFPDDEGWRERSERIAAKTQRAIRFSRKRHEDRRRRCDCMRDAFTGTMHVTHFVNSAFGKSRGGF